MTEDQWLPLAAKGEPMPEGLDLLSQYAYLAIRSVYREHRDGRITSQQGSIEKNAVLSQYRKEKNRQVIIDQVFKKHTGMYADIEGAVYRYQHDKCIENADKMLEVIYGKVFDHDENH